MKLLEPGRFTLLSQYGVPVLTNIHHDEFFGSGKGQSTLHSHGEVSLKVVDELFSLDESVPFLTESWLSRMGFDTLSHASMNHGKYVYLKSGGFFITCDPVVHADTVHWLGMDRVAVFNAGFFRASPQHLSLFGHSVSLDRYACPGGSDREPIARHLGIPLNEPA